MTWFTQNPWPVVALAVASAVGCFGLAVRTGSRWWLNGIAIGLVVGLLAVAVDWLVVTDQEAVTELVERARAAVERNDIEGVLADVDPRAEALCQWIRGAMSAAVILDAHVGDLRIEVGPEPDAARADFLGNIEARDRAGQLPYNRLIQRFEVQLRRRDGRWWITGVEMREPMRRPGAAR